MSLPRVAWATTTALFVLTAVLLFTSGYQGYAAVFLVVAAAAAVNLLGPIGDGGD